MRVRPATSDDIPWLLTQLRAFAAEHPIGPRLLGSDAHAEALLGTLLATQFVAIADEQGQPLGLLAGAIAPHPFNEELMVATELGWWIVPAHRKGKAGLALLNAYEMWAEANADVSVFTLEAQSPVSDRTLTKRGYELAERQFSKVLS